MCALVSGVQTCALPILDFDSTCTPNIPGDLSYPCISYKKTISVNSGMVKTIIANLTQTRDRGATVNNMNGHDSIVSIAINNYDCGTNRFSRKEGTTPFVSVACTVNLSEGEYTIEIGRATGRERGCK